jgi:hypothetical protein
LYKEWNQFADRGLKTTIALLKDMTEEGNEERIKKTFKDFMVFFTRMNPQQIKESIDRNKEILANIYSDLLIQMRNPVDEEFQQLFMGTSEIILTHSLIDISKTDELIDRNLSKIASKSSQDAVLDLYFLSKELMSSFRLIQDTLILGKESPFWGLPSFSLYTVKYGLGFDDLAYHMTILLEVFSNRQIFFGKRYREDVIFYLRFIDEMSKRMKALLKSPFPTLRDEDILLMDKNQAELKIDLNKKNLLDTNKQIRRLANKLMDDECMEVLFKHIKEFGNKLPLE